MNRKIIAALAALIVAGATYLLGYSSFFTVSQVEVVGSSRPIKTGVVLGEKLARVEPRNIAANLEKLDWIESAQISRNWINGKVVVQINPRTPIAIFENQVIDSTGQSFIPESAPSESLIQIQAASIEDAAEAVAFFTELPAEVRESISVVKVRSTGALVLILDNNGQKVELRWGLNSDNEFKIRVYRALIALPENAEIKRIDVSAPHAPIVK
jgi:cell division septal protein FtsQ